MIKGEVIGVVLDQKHIEHLKEIAGDYRVPTSEIVRRLIEDDRRRDVPDILEDREPYVPTRREGHQYTIRIDSVHLDHLKRSSQSRSAAMILLIEADMQRKKK